MVVHRFKVACFASDYYLRLYTATFDDQMYIKYNMKGEDRNEVDVTGDPFLMESSSGDVTQLMDDDLEEGATVFHGKKADAGRTSMFV